MLKDQDLRLSLDLIYEDVRLAGRDAFAAEAGGKTFPTLYAHLNAETGLGGIATPRYRVAALLALGIYQHWVRRRKMEAGAQGTGSGSDGRVCEDCALLIIEAMINAGRADGLIEADEYQAIAQFLKAAFSPVSRSLNGTVDRMLTANFDLDAFAARVKYHEEAIDLYLLSAVMLSGSKFIEQGYLENLGSTLRLDPSLRSILDRRAAAYAALDLETALESPQARSPYPQVSQS